MPTIKLAALSGPYLSFPEREEIALLRAKEWDVRAIARRLGRSPSTLCVFHVKLPPVPAQSCHPVQAKVATCSIECFHPSERSDAARLESVGG